MIEIACIHAAMAIDIAGHVLARIAAAPAELAQHLTEGHNKEAFKSPEKYASMLFQELT